MIVDPAAEPVPSARATAPGSPAAQSLSAQKSRLRSRARRVRSELTSPQRVRAAHGFAEGLERLIERHPDGPVLAFLPLPTEPPLTEALRALITRREVLLPVTMAQRRMLWTRWLPETQFAPSGPGGLREAIGARTPAPGSPGLVLVPALALSADGTRLGMGGGFYDTFLEHLPPRTPIVGCVYSWEVLPAGAVPADPWDALLPRVLTDRGIRALGDAASGQGGAADQGDDEGCGVRTGT